MLDFKQGVIEDDVGARRKVKCPHHSVGVSKVVYYCWLERSRIQSGDDWHPEELTWWAPI